MSQAPVSPGADAFTLEGGSNGVLLIHGYTGNPYALRPFGEWLAERGYTVHAPRLPGHGTAWQDLERLRWQDLAAETIRGMERLSARCERLALIGFSFGSALAAHLAARRPEAFRALVMLNPYVRDWRLAGVPLARRVLRQARVPGVGDDLKKQGVTEKAYERIPVWGLGELRKALKTARSELPMIRLPLLVFHSSVDHTRTRGNTECVLRTIGSEEKELVILRNSYHVAWIDNDAPLIFERTGAFLRRHLG